METYPKPPGANHELAKVIKNLSRLKFGRPHSEVQKEIFERTRLGSPAKDIVAATERTL
jgi:hypothetical protein